MMPRGSSTPPHHPTHNVHFSVETIRSILFALYPEHQTLKVEQLPSGKSFNNRIYLLEVDTDVCQRDVGPRDQSTDHQQQRFILKVSGKFFGPDKVQNEISSLLLLEKYCPDIPAPRITAWSEDGITIRKLMRSASSLEPFSIQEQQHPVMAVTRRHGWILMSRRPGRLLDMQDLEGTNGTVLMHGLAAYMSQWRRQMPVSNRVGNLRLLQNTGEVQQNEIYQSFGEEALNIAVQGLLMCHYVPRGPITTSSTYYRMKLEDQLTKLEIEEVFSAKRSEVAPMVQDFIAKTLPTLSLSSDENSPKIVFTHYDFSPRNILVSETSPIHITGVLDFEFAGFFPNEEEFTNNAVANGGDWPELRYREFLEELERYEIKTPLNGINPTAWKQACKLVQVTEDVAPWYLREGGVKGQELADELSKAAQRVREGIEELQALSHDS